MSSRALVLLCAVLAGCGAGSVAHPTTDASLLDPITGRATVPLTASAASASTLRVAFYGDTRGGREQHRAVVEAIRSEHPDLVLFTGDALRCLPTGHMPDWGGWEYLVPFWPQYFRGYAWTALFSVVPFPALLHQTIGAPFAMTRDPNGWNAFLEDTRGLRLIDRVPLLFVPGNHDTYHDQDRDELARLFAFDEVTTRDATHLYGAVDASGYRFVVLDTGDDLLGDRDPLDAEQLAWLDKTLTEADQKKLKVVVSMHMPPFSSAAEDGPVPWVKERIVEAVLDKHHIALVVTGHAHAYERVERKGFENKLVEFVVTGGGGAPFHHENDKAIEPNSKRFIDHAAHYVMMELGPTEIHGRFVPVGPYAGAGDDFTWAP